MSRKSRARAAAKAATSAKAPTTSRTLSPPGPKTFLARWDTLLASGIVVLAALAAYHNSFSGPFFFDDTSAITANSTIRHFESAFSPSPKNATFGRPLINLSFALNYALGGMKVWGYHALNLLIHTLAGLTLFGIVRRTLASRLATRGFQISNLKSKIVESPATAQSEISNLRFEMPQATLLALAVAVIWVVHPLQTEAVTYISQRAESLMGLFYLLTLYCFVRSTKVEKSKVQSLESKGTPTSSSQLSTLSSGLWLSGSVLACLLGVMSKEIIVTAPVMVLLYDRTFVAGSFREAWRQRWRYYLGLAGTWLLLARLMTGLTQRGRWVRRRGAVVELRVDLVPIRWAVPQIGILAASPHLRLWHECHCCSACDRNPTLCGASRRIVGGHGNCALALAGGWVCRGVALFDPRPDIQRGSRNPIAHGRTPHVFAVGGNCCSGGAWASPMDGTTQPDLVCRHCGGTGLPYHPSK